MGTKNKPGKFDCYTNAEPDEPMFVLLGRDPTASLVVGFWMALKMKMRNAGQSNISDEKLLEADVCSKAMAEWAKKLGKDPAKAHEAFKQILIDGEV